MFFLCTISVIMLFPILIKKRRVNKYEKLSICAVRDDGSEEQITSISQLPAYPPDCTSNNISHFIITYTAGDIIYKICRYNPTIPEWVKMYNYLYKFQCTKALALDEFGNIRDVTDVLTVYAGPMANFNGNDISLIDILKHHNIQNVYSVVTIARDTSMLGIFQQPHVQFHTAINKASLTSTR